MAKRPRVNVQRLDAELSKPYFDAEKADAAFDYGGDDPQTERVMRQIFQEEAAKGAKWAHDLLNPE